METNEQKIARLFDEMTTAAHNLAAAKERTEWQATVVSERLSGTPDGALSTSIARARSEWQRLKADELVYDAKYELAVQRWLAAQL